MAAKVFMYFLNSPKYFSKASLRTRRSALSRYTPKLPWVSCTSSPFSSLMVGKVISTLSSMVKLLSGV